MQCYTLSKSHVKDARWSIYLENIPGGYNLTLYKYDLFPYAILFEVWNLKY